MSLSEQLPRIDAFDAPLGAEVVGADLSGDDIRRDVARTKAALDKHLVVRLRGQKLDEASLIAFSRHFGELQPAPASEYYSAGAIERSPEIVVVSNIRDNGRVIGSLGNAEAEWHTDMSYVDVPPGPTILYAKEVTRSGGETSLCNMFLAYEALPEALKRRVATLRCKHDSSYTSAGDLRKGADAVTSAREAPGAIHPLVRVHPVNGRRALYLGRRRNAYLVGLSEKDSEALLDELWSYVTRPEHIWTQQWQVGDVLLWDNRWTMHHRNPFDSGERRLMLRTQVYGERPLAASA